MEYFRYFMEYVTHGPAQGIPPSAKAVSFLSSTGEEIEVGAHLVFKCETPRCPVCGTEVRGGEYHPDALCPVHKAEGSAEFEFLKKACLQTSEVLQQYLRRTKTQYRTVGDLQLPQGQQERIERCLLTTQACELSQQLLPPVIREKFLAPADSPVRNVWEILYSTYRQDDKAFWYHAVFQVEMHEGPSYVFDPTGMQYGPEVPILQNWDDYVRRRCSKTRLDYKRPLGTRARVGYRYEE
ncbi:hypothetical protein K491DRAFT_777550 [Lophiostoma macrostomum CBS 122681]|uniref:Uncharacterized protein n=1 Tax=Lophiostoma macrostomum CBS 122681 TaxID=1314788 RepID=A0A6A6TDA8_9PLEO|nr:hypothetical protein K491DRAFT_777550 [Lophiostoma macrostomum CBS 122681]